MLYFLSAATTAELLKLPLLIKHYEKHKAANKNTGIISFLKMHYQQEDAKNNSKEDRQLPFKTPHNTAIPSMIAIQPHLFLEINAKPVCDEKQAFKVPDHFRLPAKYLTIIWQPPRYC